MVQKHLDHQAVHEAEKAKIASHMGEMQAAQELQELRQAKEDQQREFEAQQREFEVAAKKANIIKMKAMVRVHTYLSPSLESMLCECRHMIHSYRGVHW
eukprot:COSAG03_NODE_28_length_18724_cov_10.718128_10_plen_99_part_00